VTKFADVHRASSPPRDEVTTIAPQPTALNHAFLRFVHEITMVAMRLFARFIALLFVVLGMSLGLAWAWDHSDTTAMQAAAVSPR
jgi:hypothetical protein